VSSYSQSGLNRSQFCVSMACRCLLSTGIASSAPSRCSCAHALPHNAWELPLARVEFVEKSATHTVQHAALQVELAGGAH